MTTGCSLAPAAVAVGVAPLAHEVGVLLELTMLEEDRVVSTKGSFSPDNFWAWRARIRASIASCSLSATSDALGGSQQGHT